MSAWHPRCGGLFAGDHVGVTAHDVALVFGWSQLLVVDELQRRQRTASMDLLDMAEGFARLADMVRAPC